MKKFISISATLKLFLISCLTTAAPATGGPDSTPSGDPVIVHLTNESFKKLVFDYEKNKTWKYEGNKPAIVDFYADWCGPCKQLSPLVEEIAKEYSGKIIVYKVDTDRERALASNLGITALPTLLFIPLQGKPGVVQGALPKENLEQAVNKVLLKKQ